ncbi:MAG: hypothetical protein ACD_45C00193G0001 [uncultured bacterium]|nr:MAG: hypothetical protein ACD_45C00193G0001 [uncultured bacterium]
MLSLSGVTVLRAYAKYLRQVGFRFSQAYIESALANHADITKALVELFKAKHSIVRNTATKKQCDAILRRILALLESVTSLDEDFIIRRFLALIQATVRTNFFQKTADGQQKAYLSLKFRSHDIPELPLPAPLFEIFVYSPVFEGIHLRNALVARGGIRWSDRREDFRTEILGLMKAQTVKNAVIVPSGAKGGFVLKNKTAVGLACYQTFIRGLLDLTDNIEGDKVVHPKEVACLDEDDPYLVVAADKGTATFSDTANQLSAEYHFWLGDAFASGGSEGYDHKKIGITARGAFESIKRHFLERDIDIKKTTITVVGIGDMSGDVFGNGLIYSKHVKLLAAFDHRHIFVDPDPDPTVSYRERLRLFRLPASSWADYNSKLISKGGGVFKRTLKVIPLSAAMQRALGTEAPSLSPVELIRVILKAPADLLYNGGIGTYVKAATENNATVGDHANDYCRVNGNELRAKVVGEGGNLGFTQLGRIEYAMQGGSINTDFIDNSAGVDCSDHEVNLKILLSYPLQSHILTYKKRNTLLASLTNAVADHVLEDNYQQALVMGFTTYHAKQNIGLHLEYIKELEAHASLNRVVEYLPDDKALLDRKANGQGLTRPELAVLLSYSKIYLKQAILQSTLTEDPYFSKWVRRGFPEVLDKHYGRFMSKHRLHREIIATQLSNMIVNLAGLTFVFRLQMETGAPISDIVRAYTMAAYIFDMPALQKAITALDGKVSCHDQYEMLFHIRYLLHLGTRWFLRSSYLKMDILHVITQYRAPTQQLATMIPDLMSGDTKKYLQTLVEKFTTVGLGVVAARRIGAYRAMYNALNVVDIAITNRYDLAQTAAVYFGSGERMHLVWFRDQIVSDLREGHWNTMARLTLRDELDICQRAFTIAVMKNATRSVAAPVLIERWAKSHPALFVRWEQLLNLLHTSTQIEYTMFFIAIRELLGLILTSQ